METCRLEGTGNLVSALDEAVGGAPESVPAIAERVGSSLTKLISERLFELPAEVCEPRPDCYARRLIHSSEEPGYDVIAMIWGPGQGTPLHDHAGVWCVEGVYQGEIEVVQYDLVEESGTRYRFQAQEAIRAHIGMSGSLIPPYEYHTIHNRLPDEASISIHVYGRGMDHCHVFEPKGDGWFEKHYKTLSCD